MISACKYHRVPIEDVNKNNGAPQRKINIYIKTDHAGKEQEPVTSIIRINHVFA